MPLSLSKTVFDGAKIGVWNIEESEDFFRKELSLSSEELELLAAMKGRRRTEWLSSRHLVHILSKREKRAAILKDEYGKPYIQDSDYYISFSHSHGKSAVIASSKTVGIDIQYLVPKITRIAHKFISDEEWQFLDPLDLDQQIVDMHVMWGAKESLYKAYGIRSLDFKNHIEIGSFEWNDNHAELKGSVQKEQFHATYKLFAEKLNKHIIVYAEEI